jgi:predicted TIM-barrel fold metal-dependent hydrolase
MMDAFNHLDMKGPDPLAECRELMRAAGVDRSVVVETGAGDNRAVLDGIVERREPGLPVIYMYRGKPVRPVVEREGVIGLRAGGKLLEGEPGWLGDLAAAGRWLLPHADPGIGTLTRQLGRIRAKYPRLNIYVPHIGWPVRGSAMDPDWPAAMEMLGRMGVTLGVSALTAFSKAPFPHDELRRMTLPALRHFRPDRLVAATDYPYVEKARYADYLALVCQWIRDVHPSWSDDNALLVG